MKRKVLLSLVLLTMIGVGMVFAQEDLFKFTDVTGGVSISAKNPKEIVGDIKIPDTYNGKKVVAVGTNGFKNCSSMTGLKISNNITDIGNSAFEGCSSIIEITMGDGVTLIGINAFRNCGSLRVLTGANIGAKVRQVRTGAFENCGKLERVWVRESVERIDDKAFNNCNSLNRINFQRADTKVGNNSFPGDLAGVYSDPQNGGKGVYEVATKSPGGNIRTWEKK